MTDPEVSRTIKEITAGSISGVAQVLIGQPFDTIKVRLQTQPKPGPGEERLYRGAIDCIQKTVRNEGLGALYKGTLSPLAGIGLCVSIQFATVEHMKRYLHSTNASASDPLTLGQLFVAGSAAGIANSVVSGPVEHIRTRMQVQTKSGTEAAYRGTVDCVRKIYGQYGLAGLYKGQVSTVAREIIGYGGYFMAYELALRYFTENGRRSKSEVGILPIMLSGAIGGFGMWLPVYPVDVVKSKLQTDAFELTSRRYRSTWDCVRKTFQAEGIAGFYRGFGPCLVRAAPVNAGTFLAFELAMRLLNR